MVATLLPKLYGIPTLSLSFHSGKTYLLSPRRGPLTHPLTIKGSKLITDKAYSEAKMRTTTHKQLVETLVGPWGVKNIMEYWSKTKNTSWFPVSISKYTFIRQVK